MKRKRPLLNRLDRALCVATGLALRGYRLLDRVDAKGQSLYLGPGQSEEDPAAAVYHVDPAGRVFARFGLADRYPVALSGSTSLDLWRVGSPVAAAQFAVEIHVPEEDSGAGVATDSDGVLASPTRPWWQFDTPEGVQHDEETSPSAG